MFNQTYINDIVDIVFLPPLDEVVEHQLRLFHIEFPGSQEPQQVVVIILRVLCQTYLFHVLSEYGQTLLLVFAHVAHESTRKAVIKQCQG